MVLAFITYSTIFFWVAVGPVCVLISWKLWIFQLNVGVDVGFLWSTFVRSWLARVHRLLSRTLGWFLGTVIYCCLFVFACCWSWLLQTDFHSIWQSLFLTRRIWRNLLFLIRWKVGNINQLRVWAIGNKVLIFKCNCPLRLSRSPLPWRYICLVD